MRLRQAKKIWNQPYLIPLITPSNPVDRGREQLERATTRLLRSKRYRGMVIEQREMEYALRAMFGSLAAAPMSESKTNGPS